MLRSVLTLIGIGGVCGVLLVGVANETAAPIQANRDAAARAVYQELLGKTLPPDSDLSTTLLGDCDQWLIRRLTQPGYAGDIEMIALWRASNNAISLRTVRHLETPGIGDFIDTRVSDWMFKQDHQPLTQWQSLDNVSGATITTNAVIRSAVTMAQTVSVEC